MKGKSRRFAARLRYTPVLLALIVGMVAGLMTPVVSLGRTSDGLYVAFCPSLARAPDGRALQPGASIASTSHAGWPPDQCLIMDKGPAGLSHMLVGENGVHNYLLGGYGNDTVIGGDAGDVIWADYHPSGWPRFQKATIRAGNGKNVIYANDTVNQVWTGTNPGTVVHAHDNRGVIHCQSPGITVFMSKRSRPHYALIGCKRISFFSYGY